MAPLDGSAEIVRAGFVDFLDFLQRTFFFFFGQYVLLLRYLSFDL